MAEDSSSSDEDLSKFEEAVDIKLTQAFSSNNVSKTELDTSTKTSNEALPPSLRNPNDENNASKSKSYLTPQVTPEFQKFVAKKLEKTLDRYLDENISENTPIENSTENSSKKKKSKKFHQQSNGIKMFRNSAIRVEEFQEDTCDLDDKIRQHNRIDHKRNTSNYDEKEEMKKIKMVAIEPNVILNQSETKAWSKNVKGDVIRVEKTSEDNVFSVKQRGYVPPEQWTGRILS
uniref:Protein CUSTOS n=1 Tax=Cacopsylla melanoneura TaxID=428564 RepID=A0A8D8W4U7_9HEMI